MSLRNRVVGLVAVVLVACATLGALVVGYRVRQDLAAELEAAMAGARQATAAAFEDLPRSDHPRRDLRQLVQTFDGNRHLRIAVVAVGGRPVMASRPSEAVQPPEWFSRLVEFRPPAVILPVPLQQGPALAVLLTPTPEPDVGAAWEESFSLMRVGGAVSAVGLVLVWLAIGAGLRPLRHLSEQFARLGAGDYDAFAFEDGPPELRLLQRGFNEMTTRLGSIMQRNRQLSEQLAQLQDEERAEIARDLHDEVGPHLFAIGLDAAMIAQLCEAGQSRDAADRTREMQRAVAYVQGQVRDLLGWLRPARLTEFGLVTAIDDLAAFWTARRPDIVFDLGLAEVATDDAVAEVAYRIIQEAVSNAVRHATARRIAITVSSEPEDRLSVSIQNDGLAQHDTVSTGTRGFGLVGMRERVAAQGGTLDYGPDASGSRWTVCARLRSRAFAPADMEKGGAR